MSDIPISVDSLIDKLLASGNVTIVTKSWLFFKRKYIDNLNVYNGNQINTTLEWRDKKTMEAWLYCANYGKRDVSKVLTTEECGCLWLKLMD